MTSHLEEGILHELLDGEIASSALPPLQAHLAACAECRARLEEAREFQSASGGLLEVLDQPEAHPPARRAPAIGWSGASWTRNLAWAATLVIAVGAGYFGGRGGSIAGGQGGAIVIPRPETANLPTGILEPALAPVDRQIASAPLEPASRQPAIANQSAPREAVGAGKAAASERTTELNEFRDAIDIAGRADSGAGARPVPLPVTPPAAAAAPAAPVASVAGADLPTPARTETGRLQRRAAEPRRDLMTTKVSAAADTISFPEALRRLNGMLRLIEGLVPDRLEAVGQEVRVVYPLTTGELYLTQRLVNGRVEYRLIGPTGFPGDSLQRLRARIRE